MSYRSFAVVLSMSAAAAATALAGTASASTLTLHAGDTFTTAHIPGMTAAKQKAACGYTALQGVSIGQTRWNWLCGTGVTVLPTAHTNAWSASHHLTIGATTHAAIIPNGWAFTTGSVNGHVPSNGALGLASAKANSNGFVADGHGVYVRGV